MFALGGRLDTTTAPELEKELKDSLEGVSELTLDFAGLEYISSAGLRVLLAAQKAMKNQGKMTIKNINETIMGQGTVLCPKVTDDQTSSSTTKN